MHKLYLDPGHGGNDSGAVGNGLREKDLTLKIARYCRDYLKANYSGVTIKMSRTGDSTKTLQARTNEANAWGADASYPFMLMLVEVRDMRTIYTMDLYYQERSVYKIAFMLK